VTAAGRGPAAAVACGERVFLRRITATDRAEFTRLVRDSQRLHHPWMQLPDTAEEFGRYLSRFDPPVVNIGLAVCELGSGAMAGGVNINTIVRGRFQSAAIGYWAFAPAAGRGLMSEALRLVIGYAFGDLDLHRLEANIQPANEASIRLAKRTGLRYEGVSPDYLFIDGAWRDHERWAVTREMVGATPHPGPG
jgi:[ribosomal protein S5]-alanine N-acetyltransferase